MRAMFKTPKPPAQLPPPPVPTVDEAAMRDENFRKLSRRMGRRATLSSSPSANAAPSVAAKTLLG